MIRAIAITAFLLSALVSPVFSWYDPMICLVNEARRQNGAGPLGFSQGLQNAAWKQAQDMQGTGIVSHFGTDGSNPLTRLAGLGMSDVGENVAGGQTTASWAMDSFMGSPGHRATLLDPKFNCFGSAQSGNFWAQEFGTSSGCSVPNCSGGRLRRRAPSTEIADTFRGSFGETATSSPTANKATTTGISATTV